MDAQETRIYTYVIILALLVGTIIVYFFISMIRQQRLNLELKKQNMVAELNSIEKERARIAADLHDELSPLVSAIKLKVSSFEMHDPRDIHQQQKTDEHLNDVVKKLRDISFNLMPVTLQRKGLAAALQELVSYVSNHHQLKIELETDGIRIDDGYAIHLYRLAQEIIHNTLKHAKASLLQLSLKTTNGKIILSSKDNGQGFNYQKKLSEGEGFGLRNLLSRTDVMNGQLFIDSKPGMGTIYTIEIPLRR